MGEPDVELTKEERHLFDRIEFDQGCVTTDTYPANAALVVRLYSLLAARNAFPPHRMRWFTDPEFNPSKHGKSRLEKWRRNGNSEEEIISHPNFLDHFVYFICGPNLPREVILAFGAAVKRCGMVSSGDIPVLSGTARKIAREHGFRAERAEEFYQLALDCGMGGRAKFIRDGIRRLR